MEASMDLPSIQEFADKKVLYLTTIGRRTGLPRQIEIWLVVYRDHFYLLAETGEAAAWVKNIRCNPEVGVRIAERQIGAMARVLSREATASCGIRSLQLPIANMDGGTGCRSKSPRYRHARVIPSSQSSPPTIAKPTVRGQHEARCDLPYGRGRRRAHTDQPAAA